MQGVTDGQKFYVSIQEAELIGIAFVGALVHLFVNFLGHIHCHEKPYIDLAGKINAVIIVRECRKVQPFQKSEVPAGRSSKINRRTKEKRIAAYTSEMTAVRSSFQ